jgi:hypothetical protein
MKQPSKIDEIGPLYAKLMEEIKRRTAAIDQISENTCALPAILVFEFCYLQLRKICEVFALACLAAHGDVPAVRSKLIQKTYNADQIIKQLDKLHPRFYPVPGRQKLDPTNAIPIEVVNIASGYLTKVELLKLYGECGNYLHRGSIRQLLSRWEPECDFEKIRDWVRKIITLLNHHQIQLSQEDTQLWVLMQSRKDKKVHWHLMKKLDANDPRVPQHLRAALEIPYGET